MKMLLLTQNKRPVGLSSFVNCPPVVASFQLSINAGWQHKLNHMHHNRPYVFRSRKHQLSREQRGIYIDLHTMQETIYWRNGKTVYWKMERTSLWHKGEKTVPGRTSFQRNWQSPKGHVPCQNIELNKKAQLTERPNDVSTKKAVGFTHFSPSNQKESIWGNNSQNMRTFLRIHFTEKYIPRFKLWNHAICTPNENSLVWSVIYSLHLITGSWRRI